MLHNLSQSFGSYFVTKWIDKIHKQNSKNHTINIGTDIPYQYGHDTGSGAVNKHGNKIDR
jgi:hypothetical protein